MMTRGKSICNVLKTIRKQIAEANEINYEPRECHHQGECRGTCPVCEAEMRYIERQLDIRQQLGKAVAIMGISAGLSALTGCIGKPKKVEGQEPIPLTEGKAFVQPAIQLDGDVEYQSPVDSVIVEKRTDSAKTRTAKFKPQEAGEATLPQEQQEENSEGDFEVLGDVDSRIIKLPLITEAAPPTLGEVPAEDTCWDVVEEMPSFPGGPSAMLAFIDSVKRYPVVAEELCAQGRVIVHVVVEKDGSMTNIKAVKGVDPSLDKEAIRVVEQMPKWIPGKQDGRPVRVKYFIPISFCLP